MQDAYNGSAVVAMAGKNCVGIASDTRLGVNQFGTVSANFQKVFKMNNFTFVGLAGLATDVQTVYVSSALSSEVDARAELLSTLFFLASFSECVVYAHLRGPDIPLCPPSLAPGHSRFAYFSRGERSRPEP